ncbi:hypothetical protein CSW62_13195 [Caulobacter sp. FWC2]|nr:hypothetical protein CSW62_13195 [Caulobacter sp. FWC2]
MNVSETGETAMALWLAPQVHAVRIASDIVFLDIASDAYLCLADAAQYLRLGPGGRIEADPPQAATDLLEAGLLASQGAGTRHIAPAPVVRGLEPAKAALSAGAVGAAIAANARAAHAIRHLSFVEILALAGTLSEEVLVGPSAALIEDCSRFARMAPWLPREGLCLMRSLQQRLYLARRGLSAAWIFGVRTWPFEAHCWLQAGDVVLDDTPEHAGSYTPILVI